MAAVEKMTHVDVCVHFVNILVIPWCKKKKLSSDGVCFMPSCCSNCLACACVCVCVPMRRKGCVI